MRQNKIISIIACMLIILIVTLYSFANYSQASFFDYDNSGQNSLNNEKKVIVTDKVENEAEQTIKETCEGICQWTTEIMKDIETINENNLEEDGTVEQENISYDGDITGDGLHLLGAYQGLTYYNQRG